MPCIHCGLPTGGGENHGTMEECIEALAAETLRLRKVLSKTDQDTSATADKSATPHKTDAPPRPDKKGRYAGS